MREQREFPAADYPPTPSIVTTYDLEHLIIYLRLVDGVADRAAPSEIAKIVLRVDPDKEPERAARIFDAHYARAVWMMEAGYRYLLVETG